MSDTSKPAKTASSMVAEAKAGIQNLTADQVAEEIANGCTLIDIRDSEERHRDGVIPGAIHSPRGMLEFHADPTSPYYRQVMHPDRRVVLHCASGGRSALAACTLKELGYRDVAHLDGGLKSWKEQGRPVETIKKES